MEQITFRRFVEQRNNKNNVIQAKIVEAFVALDGSGN